MLYCVTVALALYRLYIPRIIQLLYIVLVFHSLICAVSLAPMLNGLERFYVDIDLIETTIRLVYPIDY